MTGDAQFAGAAGSLSGTLTLPGGDGSVPGVVLIGGSGPADRHNDGLFDDIGGRLAASGVAVLAYDKRGAGSSSGTWSTATADDLGDDAEAAVQFLRAQPRVDADRVGVFGHSEGGWVALRLCARSSAPRFVIANSCPAVPFLAAEIHALAAAGAGVAAATRLFHELGAAARAGSGVDEGRRILAAHASEPWFADSWGADTLHPDSWAQLHAWVDHDPLPDLERLTVPTLVVLGADDPLVPVPESVALYEHTAAATGRRQQCVVVPDANHRMRTADGAFATGYPDLIAGFVLGPPRP